MGSSVLQGLGERDKGLIFIKKLCSCSSARGAERRVGRYAVREENDKPVFRFHPGAYEKDRAFELSDDLCTVCERPIVWRYTGQIYTAKLEPDAVCARCVASGALLDWLECPTLQLHDAVLQDRVSPELGEEVFGRTPGFATFNAFTWPVVDGQPLAFIGYGDEAEVWDDPAIQAVMKENWRQDVGEELKGPTAYLLVFKSLDGQTCCAITDWC